VREKNKKESRNKFVGFFSRKKDEEFLKKRNEELAEAMGVDADEISIYNHKKLHSPITDITIGLIILTIIMILRLNFTLVKVDGPSMQPTLDDGQFILLKKEKVNRFDIAVFKERLTDGGESKNIVKRVIGLPGDKVTVIDGVLYINDVKYEEKYLDEKRIAQFKLVNFDTIVPEGHYFVLGDNRDVSQDSRAVGNFTESSLMGVRIL
jgi:signal peptidase I